MPHTEHPSFRNAKSSDIRIWRYIDFAKFVDMIERNALYFTRVDLLGDPYEGAVPDGTIKRLAGIPSNINFILWASRFVRASLYVNCWTIRDHESISMWERYFKSSEGVAIQTTAGRLAESFRDTGNEVNIGMVEYVDYAQADLHNPDGGFNVFNLVNSKRHFYADECELRAAIWDRPANGADLSATAAGFNISADLNMLIEHVYVSPSAGQWFLDLVSALLSRYSLSFPVIRSDMSQSPRI